MNILISGPAREDLWAHFKFLMIAYNENHALRTIQDLQEGIAFIGKNPHAGQVEDQLAGREYLYRRWVVGHYKIIYLLLAKHILITHIFDTRQDPQKMRG